MTKLVWIAMVAGAMVAGKAGAQSANGDITVTNNSNHAVWVTIYKGPHRDWNLGAACAAGGGGQARFNISSQIRNSTGWKGGYYPLFEIKESKTSCAVKSNARADDMSKETTGGWTLGVDNTANLVRYGRQ